MASVKDLPFDLREIAAGMKKELLDKLTKEELIFRLSYCAKLRADSVLIRDPAVSRAVSRKAKKVRDAKPLYEVQAEIHGLEERRVAAYRMGSSSQAASDLASGYFEAIRRLREDNPQAPGIGEYLSRTGIAPAAAALVGVGPAGSSLSDKLDVKQARVTTRADAEIAKHRKRLAAETAELRREIEALKASQETDLATARGVVADICKQDKKGKTWQ